MAEALPQTEHMCLGWCCSLSRCGGRLLSSILEDRSTLRFLGGSGSSRCCCYNLGPPPFAPPLAPPPAGLPLPVPSAPLLHFFLFLLLLFSAVSLFGLGSKTYPYYVDLAPFRTVAVPLPPPDAACWGCPSYCPELACPS